MHHQRFKSCRQLTYFDHTRSGKPTSISASAAPLLYCLSTELEITRTRSISLVPYALVPGHVQQEEVVWFWKCADSRIVGFRMVLAKTYKTVSSATFQSQGTKLHSSHLISDSLLDILCLLLDCSSSIPNLRYTWGKKIPSLSKMRMI